MLNTILLQAAGAAADAVEPVQQTLPIIELLINAGLFIMVPLLILSMVAVYIFIERFIAIQKVSKTDPNFMNQIKDFIYDGKIDAAKSLCREEDTPYAHMIEKGILRIGKPMTDISVAIENVGKQEVYNLEKSLPMLATIAGAAPMIGFLGTVIGMISTFHAMSTGGNAVQITDMSDGIMQAMVTTAAGLVIGIFAYIAYNTLDARVEKVVNKMENTSIEFMDILQEPAS